MCALSSAVCYVPCQKQYPMSITYLCLPVLAPFLLCLPFCSLQTCYYLPIFNILSSFASRFFVLFIFSSPRLFFFKPGYFQDSTPGTDLEKLLSIQVSTYYTSPYHTISHFVNSILWHHTRLRSTDLLHAMPYHLTLYFTALPHSLSRLYVIIYINVEAT